VSRTNLTGKDVADTYTRWGLYNDALAILKAYPPSPPNQTEPGAVLPQNSPLVVCRAYLLGKIGNPAPDLHAASALPLEYAFPHRASLPVLRAAIAGDPQPYVFFTCVDAERAI
jgi:hypothetical protein